MILVIAVMLCFAYLTYNDKVVEYARIGEIESPLVKP